MSGFTPYSTVTPYTNEQPSWFPEEDRERIAAYLKYDEMYWNDDLQYKIRILAGETPVYIPNPRTIVDTTSYYLLKGLKITVRDAEKNTELKTALDNFMKREAFYTKFAMAKHAGVARGDYCLHLTADPRKPEGNRISVNELDPCMVVPVYDDDDLDKLLKVHIVDIWIDPKDSNRPKIKKLTYEYVEPTPGNRRVLRSEGIYIQDETWWGPNPKLEKTLIEPALLPEQITTIPVYWFKNMEWSGQQYGSSELRGFERLFQGISQATTDQEMGLALEGLGVYATDGGRPVDETGREVEWEIAPGKVMEVPSGSYFRRVEGVGSVKPSMDHINYLESKLREAGGLSDVALGRVDVQTAQSGIALAIKFIPTLAKIEERDTAGVDKLTQFWFDWKTWWAVYEGAELEGDIIPEIGQKLPDDRVALVNELNNMLDRGVISKKYYRDQMQKLGYIFPDDIEGQIHDEKMQEAEEKAAAAPPPLQGNAEGAANGDIPPPPGRGGNGTLPPRSNQSNNKNRPNESKGTESGQTLRRQSRGGKPQ